MKKILTIASAAAVLAFATTAQAATVTVGSPLTATFTQSTFVGIGDVANLALGEPGTFAASPITGNVVRWRVLDAEGTFKLRIFRPAGGGAYTAVGTSLPATIPGPGVQTFAANVPIQAGDVIALENSAIGEKVSIESVVGSVAAGWAPTLAEGSTAAPSPPSKDTEVAFNADVQSAPAIVGVSPKSASFKGDQTVTILGSAFAGATAVKFGATPASSFVVGSDSQITAIAPAVKKPGKVDITVTTAGGISAVVPADQFTYKGCVVPKLTRKKLKAAKKALRQRECKLGQVKRLGDAGSRTAKVVKQQPKPGKILAPGTKIRVTLEG